MRTHDDNASGRIVRRIRERLLLSQKFVAYQADIHPSHLARFEAGTFTPPVETVVRILDVLSVKSDDREIVLSRVCVDRFDWTEFERHRPTFNRALASTFRNLMRLDEKNLLLVDALVAAVSTSQSDC